MALDDEIIDLADLPHYAGQQCGPSRRAFCLGAGAAAAGVGLITLGVGCGAEQDPRIGTGGIDNAPGTLPGENSPPDMATKPTTGSTTSGTTSTTGSTTSGTGSTGSTTSGTGSTSSTTGTTGSTTSGTGSTGSTTGTTGSTTSSGGTTGSASCPSSMVSAGAASAVAVGKAKRIRSGQLDAWLCQDAMGYYALDNYCPHRGCTVSFQSSGSFYCGCHGATFNFNGVQTNRVSPAPMDHLAMCIDTSGNAYIDPNNTVDASTRTP
jgi:nitrite reductase/ring-hydroxylating ferredoxin subunit